MLGDIHGCRDEFLKLLKKADFKQGEDVLILTGDLVDKGPYSIQVNLSLGLTCFGSAIARAQQYLLIFNGHMLADQNAHENSAPHGVTQHYLIHTCKATQHLFG